MRAWVGILCIAVWLWATEAHAGGTVTVPVGAHVTAVDAKKQRATIDRGKLAGFKVGDYAGVFARRADTKLIDFDERVARAKVVKLEDTSAVVALDSLVGTVEVDAFLQQDRTIDLAVARAPLVRFLARGSLLLDAKQAPLVTLEDRLADPSQAATDKLLDALIAAIKASAKQHADAKALITFGPNHGKRVEQVIDTLDRAQALELVRHVEGNVAYTAEDWPASNVYVFWLLAGSPPEDASSLAMVAGPELAAARRAAASGNLADARKHCEAALAAAPREPEAGELLDVLYRVDEDKTKVAKNPDDAAARLTLYDDLFWAGAWSLMQVEYKTLRASKYEAKRVEDLYGQALAKQSAWTAALAHFKQFAKEFPDTDWLESRRRWLEAQAHRAKAPTDPAALLELAAAESSREALLLYRAVLDSTRATVKQRAAAADGQRSVRTRGDIDALTEQARNHVWRHEIDQARARIDDALRLADQIASPFYATRTLTSVIPTAKSSFEPDFAITLLELAIKREPQGVYVHKELAAAYLEADRYDDAAVIARTLIGLKSPAASYGHAVLAVVAAASNDLDAAEKHAQAYEKTDRGWARLELARIAVARDDWDKAVALAREGGDWAESAVVGAAVMRGQRAHEALSGDPSSARERLRLVRALADVGSTTRAKAEIAKLPTTGTWQSDGWWALAENAGGRTRLADRLAAARSSKSVTPARKDMLGYLEAMVSLRANPKDDTARLALATAHVKFDQADKARATLAPIASSKAPAVTQLAATLDQITAGSLDLYRGTSALSKGDYAEALKAAGDVQSAADRLDVIAKRIDSRNLRAKVLAAQGKYTEAIAAAEDMQRVAVAYGHPSWIAYADQRVGELRSTIGTLAPKAAALDRALKTCEANDDEHCLYDVHLNLAAVASNDGRTVDQADHARASLKLAEAMGQTRNARFARITLAWATLEGGHTKEADEMATVLLKDSRAEEDLDHEYRALMLLAAVATYRGDHTERARYGDAYRVASRLGIVWMRADARGSAGRAALFAEHDPKTAIPLLDEAAKLYGEMGMEGEPYRGGALLATAHAHLQAGRLADARTTAEAAMKIIERFERRWSLFSAHLLLARIAIAEKRADEALAQAKQTVQLASVSDSSEWLASAYHVLARGHALRKNDKEAYDAYEKALEHLQTAMRNAGGQSEQKGRLEYGDTRTIYKDAVAHYLSLKKTKRAMEVLDLLRDAELDDAFDPTKTRPGDPQVKAQLDELARLRAEVKALEQQRAEAKNDKQRQALGQQIAKTQAEMKALTQKLSKDPRYGSLAMEPQSLAARRRDLPDGSVVVEYFITEGATYAFIVDKELQQPAIVQINVTDKELAHTVAEFRAAIVQEKQAAKARDRVDELGRKLARWLLEPLRPHIAGATTLVVVPFGTLYSLPFEALVVSPEGKPVRYAIEDFRISIQSKKTIDKLFIKERKAKTGTLLAVSNPDGSLAGAAREVLGIVKTVPDAKVLDRKTGTFAKFTELVGQYRYVHLATHGFVEADPLKTFLKLADRNLTTDDVAILPLEDSNEMVVLSACESAVESEPTAVNEQISLASAFAHAGAPTVVASLWEVDDNSTADLMGTFYRALDGANGDWLDAMRNAKLSLIRFKRGNSTPYAEPWHWAAFQLLGDYRTPSK